MLERNPWKGVSPAFLATIPREKATAKYPAAMGMPSRRPSAKAVLLLDISAVLSVAFLCGHCLVAINDILYDFINFFKAKIIGSAGFGKNFRFFKDNGYDIVLFECRVSGILPGGGADSRVDSAMKTVEDFRNYLWGELPDRFFEANGKMLRALRKQLPEGMKAVGGGNGIFECVQDLAGYERPLENWPNMVEIVREYRGE